MYLFIYSFTHLLSFQLKETPPAFALTCPLCSQSPLLHRSPRSWMSCASSLRLARLSVIGLPTEWQDGLPGKCLKGFGDSRNQLSKYNQFHWVQSHARTYRRGLSAAGGAWVSPATSPCGVQRGKGHIHHWQEEKWHPFSSRALGGCAKWSFKNNP